MAGETQNMERSTLERKDRAELAAVAAALSIKVPSRAKKADIVSLILEAVGQGDAPAPAPEGQASLLESEPQSAPAPRRSQTAAGQSSAGKGDAPAAAPAPKAVEAHGAEAQAETASGDTPHAGADAGESADEGTSAAGSDTEDASGEDGGDDAAGEGGSSRRRRRRRGRDRAGEGGTEPTPGGTQPADNEPEPIEVQGLLDLRDDGYGFLRVSGFVAGREDVYVSVKQCRQLGLRKGDYVSGVARPASHKEKNPALVRVETVNGLDPEQARNRVRFDELTAIDPTSPLSVGGLGGDDLTGDLVDALAPIHQGQRQLVVTPPNADARPVLSTIAAAIEQRYPDTHLVVLLIDERPEAVTAFRKSLDGGEIVAATYDRPAEQQSAVAELAIEHAKRLVEYGNDVVVLLDSLTGLTRAYNLSAAPGGRTIAGELDASALASAKRIFGAARDVEDGGSLTIVATALTETNSLVDDAILIELQRGANATLLLEAATPPAAVRPLPVGASPANQKALLAELGK